MCSRLGRQRTSTLLHESSNSEPETIKQSEIVFHDVRVRVARVGVIPFIRAKPATVDREHTSLVTTDKKNKKQKKNLMDLPPEET